MRLISAIALFILTASLVHAGGQGMISVASNYGVATTTDRLQAALEKKGMKVFLRIDHAAGAKSVDKELRPTQLLVFGNPKIGTTLMQCTQTIGIDLPLKALIWEDTTGKVWLSYNDPLHLLHRHGVETCGEVIAQMTNALKNFAAAATMKE